MADLPLDTRNMPTTNATCCHGPISSNLMKRRGVPHEGHQTTHAARAQEQHHLTSHVSLHENLSLFREHGVAGPEPRQVMVEQQGCWCNLACQQRAVVATWPRSKLASLDQGAQEKHAVSLAAAIQALVSDYFQVVPEASFG